MNTRALRVAILSMYRRQDAPGLLYLRHLLRYESRNFGLPDIHFREFQTRDAGEIPETAEFDVFISTGGPGNPFDGEGSAWEKAYFGFLDKIYAQEPAEPKKFLFSICHSFQLLCRYFSIAEVRQREGKTRFGIFSAGACQEGTEDPLFGHLPNPYLIVENRNWECVNGDKTRMASLGIKVLARENADQNSALLALRISPAWVATQFHPETQPEEMKRQFLTEAKRKEVISTHGKEAWEETILRLDAKKPSLQETWELLLPRFLAEASAAFCKTI